jgi:hypothetical protein
MGVAHRCEQGRELQAEQREGHGEQQPRHEPPRHQPDGQRGENDKADGESEDGPLGPEKFTQGYQPAVGEEKRGQEAKEEEARVELEPRDAGTSAAPMPLSM